MKDLKHLIYFEHLLDEAANELVMQAVSEGKHAVGYTCYHMPEVLLNLDNCFSVRMRAPRTGSLEISTYYMTNYLCGYTKALVERGIEGGYNFLSALAGGETCTEMNRTLEHFEVLQLVKNENFFVSFIDVPFKVTPHGLEHYKNQITKKVLEPLHERYGTDISDASIRKAVAEHNEVCRIITEIGDMRKLPNPPVTGYEFHVIQLVSLTCPKDLILPYLRETLEEIKSREPEPKFPFRARVMVAGSEIDDPDFTKLLEGCGAYVVADRYCFGSIPGREEIIVKPDEDILQAIADHYIQTNQCPRAMGPENVVARKQFLYKIAQEYGAEGVIVENMKFCEYWGYERAQAAQWMRDGFSLPGTLPVCQIEKDYTNAATGQLRTRFQAFVESLEIKRIQSEK